MTNEEIAAIYDAFHIGVNAREPHILMVNISNAIRRSNCLTAVENEFFMVQVPAEVWDDENEPDQECLLNWGQEPDQYVATFREALKAVALSRPNAQGSVADEPKEST